MIKFTDLFDTISDNLSNDKLDELPIHNIIKALQKSTLARIHHPRIIHRIHDNVLKVDSSEEKLTIHELFNTISDNLWIELDKFDEIWETALIDKNLRRIHI